MLPSFVSEVTSLARVSDFQGPNKIMNILANCRHLQYKMAA
jgi:hypothetical protein